MAALVIADHDNQALRDTTLKSIAAAKALSPEVDVLVMGQGADAAAKAAAGAQGVRKVLLAQSPELAQGLAEAAEALILPLAVDYEVIAAPTTSAGKNLIPRLAAKLDAALISEVVAVAGPRTFVRPIYAGNVLETVEAGAGKLVMTIRPTAFAPVAAEGGGAAIETLSPPPAPAHVRFVSEEVAKSDRPELGAAKIVVSGGRAMGSAEEFKAVIEPLADKLGAAVGASRAAVDAGYAANDLQVGQTGKVVAPQLYLAIGISGAIQHLAGMKDSKVIAAINKDADAPIFQIADYGLVADYKTAAPELMAELSRIGR